jgi:hypothetical protein
MQDMTDQKKTVIGGNLKATATRGKLSDQIAASVRTVSELIGEIDNDPIIQLALARVATRTFVRELVDCYPEHTLILSDELTDLAAALRGEEPMPAAITRALKIDVETDRADQKATAETGEPDDAEDREPLGDARGREQADPEGRDTGRSRRGGARNHGSQRVGKEYAILRVGGS